MLHWFHWSVQQTDAAKQTNICLQTLYLKNETNSSKKRQDITQHI